MSSDLLTRWNSNVQDMMSPVKYYSPRSIDFDIFVHLLCAENHLLASGAFISNLKREGEECALFEGGA